MSCLVLSPAQPCVFGDCIIEGNSTQEFCSCYSGWESGIEFNYFVSEADIAGRSCTYPAKAIHILYIVAFSSLVVASVIQIASTGLELKRARRRWTILASLAAYTVATFYRSTINQEGFFGQDVFFTFFMGNGLGFVAITEKNIILGYMLSLVKRNEWSSSRVEQSILEYHKFEKCAMFFDIAFSQLFWLTCFMNQKAALKVLRVTLGWLLLRAIRLLWYSRSFLALFEQELDTVARYKWNLASDTKIEADPEVSAWVNHQRKKANQLNYISLGFIINLVSFLMLPIFWDLWVVGLLFGLPIAATWWSTTAIWYAYLSFKLKTRSNPRARAAQTEAMQSKPPSSDGIIRTRNEFHKHILPTGEIVRISEDNNTNDSDSEDELV